MVDVNKNKDFSQSDSGSPVNLFDRLRFMEPEKFSMKKIPGEVSDKADVATMILAGGEGTRLRADLGIENNSKQLLKMSGKPVLT